MTATTCTNVPTFDTDTGKAVWVCTRHRHHHPCPHTGKPPLPGPPVHVDRRPSYEESVSFARYCTGGVRDVVVHTDFGTEREHETGESTDCWCGPEVLR